MIIGSKYDKRTSLAMDNVIKEDHLRLDFVGNKSIRLHIDQIRNLSNHLNEMLSEYEGKNNSNTPA